MARGHGAIETPTNRMNTVAVTTFEEAYFLASGYTYNEAIQFDIVRNALRQDAAGQYQRPFSYYNIPGVVPNPNAVYYMYPIEAARGPIWPVVRDRTIVRRRERRLARLDNATEAGDGNVNENANNILNEVLPPPPYSNDIGSIPAATTSSLRPGGSSESTSHRRTQSSSQATSTAFGRVVRTGPDTAILYAL